MSASVANAATSCSRNVRLAIASEISLPAAAPPAAAWDPARESCDDVGQRRRVARGADHEKRTPWAADATE
jgi:hypothetical protein